MSTARRILFGADIGGTSARLAAVDEHGQILAFERTATSRIASRDRLLSWLRESVASIGEELHTFAFADLTAGIAVAGLVDRQSGTVVRSINLPFLNGRPLASEVAHSLGLERVALMTDAEAATWGEYIVRRHPPRRFIHLRIGTGVALGVINNGRFRELELGRTTHARILVVDDSANAIPCRCGLSGCLETIASGMALESKAHELGFTRGLTHLEQAATNGDPKAHQLIEVTARAVETALWRITKSYQPDVICLGGGVIDAVPHLARAIYASDVSPGFAMPSGLQVLEPTRLGDNAGVIGAAMNSLWDRLSSRSAADR